MDKANHTGAGKDWKASDFERYYKNNMAPEERHALEKDALDDPFLQDALEGYAHTHSPVDDVKKIKALIQPGKEKAPVIWYRQMTKSSILKVAAMLIVFAGFTWIYLANTNENESKKLVTLTNDGTAPKAADSGKIEDQPAIAFTESSEPEIENSKLVGTEVVKQKNKPASVPETTISKSTDNTTPGLIAATQPKISTLVSPRTKSDSVEIINIKGAAAKKTAAPAAAQVEEIGDLDGNGSMTVIRGRVLDTDGSPVPYARINGSGNNQMLSSDKDGFFALNNTGKTLNVNVNALGYETTNAILSPDNPENKIILKETENLALNEIKVSTNNAQSRKKADTEERKQSVKLTNVSGGPGLQIINAVPVDGWAKYNQKFEALRKGQSKSDSTGDVSLAFKIDSTGRPVEIKLIKSLTPATNSAAIYLLQNALPLKAIKKGMQSSVVISFR